MLKNCVCLLWFVAACSGGAPPQYRSDSARIVHPDVQPADVAALVTDNTQFAADLYRVLPTSGNVVDSPYSVSLVLGISTALTDNPIFSQPSAVRNAAFDGLDLAIEHDTSGQIVWHNEVGSLYPPPQDYLDLIARYFGAGIHRLPAHGFVDETLVNDVKLAASWTTAFDAVETRPGSFQGADGTTASVPCMHQTLAARLAVGALRAAELDFAGEKLSLLIVVPDDLAAFEASLSASTLGAIVAALTPTQLEVSLPKFSIATQFDLIRALAATKFGPLTTLPGIGGGAWTGNHVAAIEISERGVQATAQTSASHTPVASSPTFAVDRPFLFFVRHRATGSILFMGRVVDPAAPASDLQPAM